VVALDKSRKKITKLKENIQCCSNNIDCVEFHCFDATKALDHNAGK